MVSRDEGAKEAMGTNPVWPTGPVATVTGLAINLAVAPEAPEGLEAPLLADPADTDDEKACWDAFQLIMQGFHAALYLTGTSRLARRYRPLTIHLYGGPQPPFDSG